MMRRHSFLIISFFLMLCFALLPARAQNSETRAAQWDSYAPAPGRFVRQVDKTTGWSLWRPADWNESKRENSLLDLTAPDQQASVSIGADNVPEGYGIASYVSSFLRQIRQQRVNPETVKVRRVWPGGIEGREVLLDLERSPGDVVRETIWMAQAGPRVYLFFFFAPADRHAQLEPLFKRMMMTLHIGAAGHWNAEFEQHREYFAGRETQPDNSPELEAAQIAAALRTAQEPGLTLTGRLAALASRAPDTVLDLMTDPDPQVRASAIKAFSTVDDPVAPNVLVWAMTDKDAYCSAVAAQALAAKVTDSGPVTMIFINRALPVLSDNPGVILNLAAALSDDKARQMADALLGSDNSRGRIAGLQLAVTLPLRGLQLPVAKLLQSKDEQFLALLAESVRMRPNSVSVPELLKLLKAETEYGAAQLLGEVAPPEVAAQLDQHVKEIDARLEKIAPQFKVTALAGKPVQKAEKNKAGDSGPPAPPPPAPENPEVSKLAEARGALVTAADKIRFRDRYARAKNDADRAAIYQEARNHTALSAWAAVALRSPATATALPDAAKLAEKFNDAPTTGETLFPQDATLYLMAPNFEQTLARLDAALSGVQMETVRDQMTFALLLKMMKAGLANSLSADTTASVSAALGLDLKAPVAVAQWNDAQQTTHSAVLARVTDRARFERMLWLYQKQFGGLGSFAVVSSALTRFAGILPAAAPLFMAAAFSDPEGFPARSIVGRPGIATISFRQERLGSLPVTVIEKLTVTSKQTIEREQICLAWLGSTAVLTPSREALADLLGNAATRPTIAQSAGLAQARATSGEIIFFSHLDRLFQTVIPKRVKPEDGLIDSLSSALGHESGTLRVTPTTWETVFHLTLQNNDWLKSFRTFSVRELTAPQKLLPHTTVLYAGAIIDPPMLLKAIRAAGTISAKKEAKDPEQEKKARQLDDEIEKLLLPNLHGEAAFALLNLAPTLKSNFDKPPALALALRLKNNEPARLFRSGKLFAGASPAPEKTALGSPVASFELSGDKFFFTITDDYLILAESAETLKLFEDREKFAATRDYLRSTEALPDNLAFFTTYSLDAAFNEARQLAGNDENAQSIISVVSAVVHAFHSQRAFIAASPAADGKVALEGRLAVSFDREGRYAVGNISPRDDEFNVANALIVPKGLNIVHSTRLESMKLRVTARQPGIIARVRDDVSKFSWQRIDGSEAENSLAFTTTARRIPDQLTIRLPVTEPEFQLYLKSTARINTAAPEIIRLAHEIAGDDRDGRSVARKLGEWTHNNLKWKKVESSTVETLASREADCLEHAELYVALARSLGLPARVVTGAAYGDGSFGAHAWVEIYLGQWVEVDPTWGLMDYVDATHLRFADDAFVSYAMLNQLELEILDTRSTIADFQRDPVRLIKEFAAESSADARELVFDLSLAADAALGAGALAKLNEKQRAAIINAFDRIIGTVTSEWVNDWAHNPRILSRETGPDRATILALFGQGLLRFTMVARNGAWYVTEIENVDEATRILSEPLRGTLNPETDRARIENLAPEQALPQLEELIKKEGESAPLLLLKSRLLHTKQITEMLLARTSAETENKNQTDQKETPSKAVQADSESTTLLKQITTRFPDFAPAWYALAANYPAWQDDREKAIEPLQRYVRLMPSDPRPWQTLAAVFDHQNRLAEAESAFREAIARDRENHERYVTLAAFHFDHQQTAKARAVLTEALGISSSADLVFDDFGSQVRLFSEEKPDKERSRRLEELLTGFPKELSGSRAGLHWLATAQEYQGSNDAAIKSVQRAIAIKPEADDYTRISGLHRTAQRYQQALAAADRALKLNAESAGAHFERACALARLNRKKEALAALKKAVELDEDYLSGLDDEDLKSLADLPEFKALLPKDEPAEKPAARPDKPVPPKR
ncbi:MAG: transglutaminase domain-containing protein [Blastocatellia bacterium]